MALRSIRWFRVAEATTFSMLMNALPLSDSERQLSVLKHANRPILPSPLVAYSYESPPRPRASGSPLRNQRGGD
jgi:hypothetical protein